MPARPLHRLASAAGTASVGAALALEPAAAGDADTARSAPLADAVGTLADAPASATSIALLRLRAATPVAK